MISKPRYLALDAVRGFALLLMIVFHVSYDLNLFRFVTIDFQHNPFWFAFPRVIASLFLLCVGISLALVHKDRIRWTHTGRRVCIIGGWALVVTATTYVLFPRNVIYFGILHCIAVSSVLGLWFVRRPVLSLACAVLIVGTHVVFRPSLPPISDWLGVSPLDNIPLYPWFGIVLFGIFLESVNAQRARVPANRPVRFLAYAGRHSLVVYLVHQPVLVGVLYGYAVFMKGV